jgi:ATP-dependent helicase HrpA
MDMPEKESLLNGVKVLKELGAVEETGRISAKGKEMAELPMDPVYSSVLFEAVQRNVGNYIVISFVYF